MIETIEPGSIRVIPVNYEFVNSMNGGDAMIKPIAGYDSVLSGLLISKNGDSFWSKDGDRMFDINTAESGECSSKYYLPCNRIRSYNDVNLGKLSEITKIPLIDLKEIRNLQREIPNLDEIITRNNPPHPLWG
jgi:hypothetical protein